MEKNQAILELRSSHKDLSSGLRCTELALVKSESEVAQSCPTLCEPMDCSPPGSSVHGIFQARVLEWGAIASMAGGLVSIPGQGTKIPYAVQQPKEKKKPCAAVGQDQGWNCRGVCGEQRGGRVTCTSGGGRGGSGKAEEGLLWCLH